MRHEHEGRVRARLTLPREAHGSRRGFQIGPKIRIGGTLGHIGQDIKIGVGKLNKAIAKPLSVLNPAFGAIAATSGKMLDTSDGGSSLGDLVKAGATNYAGGKLAQAIPGVGKLAGKVPGVGGSGLPENIVFDGAGNVVSGGSGGGLGQSLLGGLKSVGKFALDNPDLIGGAIAGVSGFKTGQQSDDLRNQAISAMSDRPDLSSIFADPGNPYNRYAQHAPRPKAAGRLAA